MLYILSMTTALLLLLSLAWADGPQVEVGLQADGTVVGVAVVPATPAAILELVEDPIRSGKLSPDVIRVSFERDGDCVEIDTEARGVFKPLRYKSRRCPTENGWRDQLVESDSFTEYDASWSLRPVDGGTEVTIRVQTEVTLPIPVPRSVVKKRQKVSVGETLENLIEQLVK